MFHSLLLAPPLLQHLLVQVTSIVLCNYGVETFHSQPLFSDGCFALFLPNNIFDYNNLLKPTCHVMHQQFNIQQLYVLPTLYLRVLYLSENKQRLVSLTA